jgi:8-oxo-dGTP pyrophosphatase MutT (NUDIX family)
MKLTRDRVRSVLRSEHAAQKAGEPLRKHGVLLAGVAAILSSQEPLELLLIKRAAWADDPWSAHMAFPGGKLAPEDDDLLATAARETQEELGLDLTSVAEYLGPLPCQCFSRLERELCIRPFVFALRQSTTFTLNHEVDEVVWVTLDSLSNGSRTSKVLVDLEGKRLEFPAWEVQGHHVWGLTYRMVESLLSLLRESPL